MVRIIEKVFTEMCQEYLLNQKEAENVVDSLKHELTGGTLKDMYASGNREAFAKDLLTPLMDKIIARRQVIHMPTNEQMVESLKEVLEKLA